MAIYRSLSAKTLAASQILLEQPPGLLKQIVKAQLVLQLKSFGIERSQKHALETFECFHFLGMISSPLAVANLFLLPDLRTFKVNLIRYSNFF